MKVTDLDGDELDVWVARALGEKVVERDGLYFIAGSDGEPSHIIPQYSSNWCCGGPIIERENISLYAPIEHGNEEHPEWGAAVVLYQGPNTRVSSVEADGPMPLIAAMRCFVASKFGEEVGG